MLHNQNTPEESIQNKVSQCRSAGVRTACSIRSPSRTMFCGGGPSVRPSLRDPALSKRRVRLPPNHKLPSLMAIRPALDRTGRDHAARCTVFQSWRLFIALASAVCARGMPPPAVVPKSSRDVTHSLEYSCLSRCHRVRPLLITPTNTC